MISTRGGSKTPKAPSETPTPAQTAADEKEARTELRATIFMVLLTLFGIGFVMGGVLTAVFTGLHEMRLSKLEAAVLPFDLWHGTSANLMQYPPDCRGLRPSQREMPCVFYPTLLFNTEEAQRQRVTDVERERRLRQELEKIKSAIDPVKLAQQYFDKRVDDAKDLPRPCMPPLHMIDPGMNKDMFDHPDNCQQQVVK